MHKQKEGHMTNCDQYKMDHLRQDYGDYAADIIEGRQDDETSLSHESDIENVREHGHSTLDNTLSVQLQNTIFNITRF